MSERNLPYEFDLHWDLKTMDDVEKIAKGEAHHSDATIKDLIDLFELMKMSVPDCLNVGYPTETIWLCKDGTWTETEPSSDVVHLYVKTRINTFIDWRE
jgi:hypothetical protein